MVLKKQGPGTVTAGDIQTVGDVQILNPELVLCTLDEGAEIRMEFTVMTGKGYVPAERNRPDDAPIGLIPVDSLYLAGAQGVLSRREYPRRPDSRLRQADDDDRDQRRDHARKIRSPLPRAFCRTSSTSSSISKSRAARTSGGDAGAAVQSGAS